MQSLVDFGVNEESVHFLNHSQVVPKGGYDYIHDQIIRISEIYYNDLKTLDFSHFRSNLNNDFLLIQRIFLPCTWIKIEKFKLELELEYSRDLLLLEYQALHSLSPTKDEPYPLVFTAFGKMLFTSEMSTEATRKIKAYIDFLGNHLRLKEIEDYNSMVKFK